MVLLARSAWGEKECKLGVLVKAARSVMKYLSRMCLVKVWKLFANC